MKTYAIDTETYYDKNVSVKDLGAEAYTRHPDYYCGMVSIVGPDVRFVGKPQDAPWNKLRGAAWVAHNVQFDRWVLNRLWDQGVIPDDVRPSKWRDTTAIPAYLQVSRDLGNAAKVLLGKTPDKSVRTQMSGKHFDQLTPERYQILCDYALTDAALCYELYTKFHNKLPQDEWDLAELTVEQGDYGVQINTRLLEDYLATVQTHQIQLLDQIPWRADKPALSQAALRTQLCADGAGNLPKTTSADDPAWAEWSQKNADRFPYMEAFVQLRRLNKHLSTLQTIQNRLDTGGVLHFSMKYCGARVTGRWAGDAGINMQNLTKGELFGASVRDLFVPRDGHKFIIADMSQIEMRVAAAIAGDTKFLGMLEQGIDCYEAHARTAMGYKDPRPLKEVDPDLRQIAKARCLSLQFGTGPDRFREFAKNFGLDMSEAEAKKQVKSYRLANKGLVSVWNELENTFNGSIGDPSCDVTLPTKRKLRYFDVAKQTVNGKTGMNACVQRGKNIREWFWGSKLFENVVQATARDVFAAAMLRIDRGGIRTAWHVHDELICEVPEDQAQDALEFVTEEMSKRHPALPDMPLGVDAHIASVYDK
jgi:hypothetical protein